MPEPTWNANPIGERLPLGDLEVHLHDGEALSENWVCSYVVWTDMERARFVAERRSWEIGELTFPSEDEPLVVRRIKREVLGEGPRSVGEREALFGRVIVPLLDGEWVPLGQVRAGDTITEWSERGIVPPNDVLGVEQDGPRLSIDLADNYGHPFPGNPLLQQAREWVQVQRGPASERQEGT